MADTKNIPGSKNSASKDLSPPAPTAGLCYMQPCWDSLKLLKLITLCVEAKYLGHLILLQ